MKLRLFSFFLCLLFVVVLHAQQDEGVIFFEERVNVHRVLSEENAYMKALVPEYSIMHSMLFFNNKESLFRNVETSDSLSREIKVSRPEYTYYTNFKSGRKSREFYFSNQQYLIEEEICAPSWILNDETQTILGYSCRLATFKDTLSNGHIKYVKAWFAGELPHGIGPMSYGQLPGTILKLDFNEGEHIFEATQIEFRKVKKKEMKAPNQGKKITREAYQAMFE